MAKPNSPTHPGLPGITHTNNGAPGYDTTVTGPLGGTDTLSTAEPDSPTPSPAPTARTPTACSWAGREGVMSIIPPAEYFDECADRLEDENQRRVDQIQLIQERIDLAALTIKACRNLAEDERRRQTASEIGKTQ
jgi:hypothetical protein